MRRRWKSAASGTKPGVRPAAGASREHNTHPEDTAWRIHAAVADWTGKFDAKASFALTIESAILVAITALSGGGRRLGKIDGFAVWVFYLGVVALATGALFAITVVSPRLRKSEIHPGSNDNFMFFGHIRHWDPAGLETALREQDVLPLLSRQLVIMSEIAWTKHERVKKSFAFAVLGAVLVALAGIFG
ncbi:Pycsar system effector family protein [Streptomyces sp. NPDC002514]|uniref:Pycsar system effector family protein n=1 Tax=Streptomyces sp. NPDC001270 TaxID=3364554 RepID=UPI00369869E2